MSQEASQSVPQTIRRQPDNPSSSSWARPLKQFGFFFIGAGFMAASIAVSRRSVIRRQRESFPRFHTSNWPAPKVDGSLLAVQALGLATLNVCTFAVLLTGGLAWAFDLSSLEELRGRTRKAMQGPGRVDPEDEREFELAMNNLLARLGMDKLQTNQPSETLPKD